MLSRKYSLAPMYVAGSTELSIAETNRTEQRFEIVTQTANFPFVSQAERSPKLAFYKINITNRA